MRRRLSGHDPATGHVRAGTAARVRRRARPLPFARATRASVRVVQVRFPLWHFRQGKGETGGDAATEIAAGGVLQRLLDPRYQFGRAGSRRRQRVYPLSRLRNASRQRGLIEKPAYQ